MLCRLCVNECSDFINIFNDKGNLSDVSCLISKYLTFKVTRDDEYSTIVCKSCLEYLVNFHTFCKSVVDAQEKWQIIADLMLKDESTRAEFLDEKEQIDELISGEHNEEISFIDEDSMDSSENPLRSEDEETLPQSSTDASSKREDKSEKTRLSAEFGELIASHKKLFCNECNKPMDSFRSLKKHFKTEHNTSGYMICCARKFFRAADLADHISLHLNPELFKCLECGKCFSSRYSLDSHLKTLHLKEETEKQSFQCNYCSKKYLSKCVLDKHLVTHTEGGSNNENFLCVECGKGYPSESKLKAHNFNVHRMLYRRMCHLCGKIVRGNKALERHQLQHAGIKETFKCDICGIELSTKGILKAHIISLHPEDSNETHECNICGKNAPSKRALKYHIDYVHKLERAHKCTVCEKSFKRLQALTEHITTHTGDRLYECPHCPKTFKVRSNMHHHRKVKHPKEFEENRLNRPVRK